MICLGARLKIARIVLTLALIATPTLTHSEIDVIDADGDGVGDDVDNCPAVYNPDQTHDCADVPLLHSSQASLSSSLPIVLYDVDFGTPPHTIGQPPVLGSRGPAPRDVPTRFLGLVPTVVAAVGVMDQQPLQFESGGIPFEQVKFGIGNRFDDGGFDFQLPNYHFELTVMIISEGRLIIFFDGPTANSVQFTSSDGHQIRASVLGTGQYNIVIGQWDPGVPRRLVVDIDRAAEHWTIALDGEEVFSGPYPKSCCGEMRSLRVSASLGVTAAIDDVIVSDGLPPVEIDIRPGSEVNSINPRSRGVIPVAILGSDTFDVLDVDANTLAFGPAGAATKHAKGGHRRDVNNDGLDDLLSHYYSDETGIAFGDTKACVTGETLDGMPFVACDDIRTVPACGIGFELAFLLPPLMMLHARPSRGSTRPAPSSTSVESLE